MSCDAFLSCKAKKRGPHQLVEGVGVSRGPGCQPRHDRCTVLTSWETYEARLEMATSTVMRYR
jgi:hypothetical protein